MALSYRPIVQKCSDPADAGLSCLFVTVAVTSTKSDLRWIDDAQINTARCVERARVREYHGCHVDARRIVAFATYAESYATYG
jgi:hypothetical protein